MNTPQPVKSAVTAISICIALSALAALLDRVTGRMSVGEFAFNIAIYGMMVMIPYKLVQRSNATRVVYAVLMAISILWWLGGPGQQLPLFTKIASIIELPLSVLSIYWLFFVSDASEWFSGIASNASEDTVRERTEPRL